MAATGGVVQPRRDSRTWLWLLPALAVALVALMVRPSAEVAIFDKAVPLEVDDYVVGGDQDAFVDEHLDWAVLDAEGVDPSSVRLLDENNGVQTWVGRGGEERLCVALFIDVEDWGSGAACATEAELDAYPLGLRLETLDVGVEVYLLSAAQSACAASGPNWECRNQLLFVDVNAGDDERAQISHELSSLGIDISLMPAPTEPAGEVTQSGVQQ